MTSRKTAADSYLFIVEKPKRKKPKTNKTKIEKSQQHLVSEPINIESTDFNCGSDGVETEHLENGGLVQTGNINLS